MSTLVVIVFVDNPEMTIRCIKSVKDNILSQDNVVLVDNSSKKSSSNKVRKANGLSTKKDWYSNTDSADWMGRADKSLAGAWNHVIQQYPFRDNYDFICFLHNDTVVSKGWLTEMRLAFDSDPDCGIAFPRQSLRDKHGFTPYDIIYPHGYAFMLSKSTINKVRLFDTSFKIKSDMDYFKRTRSHGLKLVVCGRSNVEHIGGQTWPKMYSLSEYMDTCRDEVTKIIDRR